jgi:hypothetical protein
MSLPNSSELADLLLNAAKTAESLGAAYHQAWLAAKTARVNRDLAHDDVVAAAYADPDAITGKNAEQRAAQMATFLDADVRLSRAEATLRHAEAEVKQAEVMLESARVYRAALHDLVSLRFAELEVAAATLPRQARPRAKKVVLSETA